MRIDVLSALMEAWFLHWDSTFAASEMPKANLP
jgi:hypothetical protein